MGHFPPGQPLPAATELATEFGVSRPLVREALRIVATLGMVENHQGRFSRVSAPESWRNLSPEVVATRSEIGVVDDILDDSLELRRVIETEAAALAAQRATPEDIERLRGELQALGDSIDNPHRYALHDISFHDSVLRATHNHLLLQLIDHMGALLLLVRDISHTGTAERLPDSQGGHRAIFEAIAARTPEAARAAMADHLAWAERTNVPARQLSNSKRHPPCLNV